MVLTKTGHQVSVVFPQHCIYSTPQCAFLGSLHTSSHADVCVDVEKCGVVSYAPHKTYMRGHWLRWTLLAIVMNHKRQSLWLVGPQPSFRNKLCTPSTWFLSAVFSGRTVDFQTDIYSESSPFKKEVKSSHSIPIISREIHEGPGTILYDSNLEAKKRSFNLVKFVFSVCPQNRHHSPSV